MVSDTKLNVMGDNCPDDGHGQYGQTGGHKGPIQETTDMDNHCVEGVQKWLQDNGYDCNGVDGMWGPGTQEAWDKCIEERGADFFYSDPDVPSGVIDQIEHLKDRGITEFGRDPNAAIDPNCVKDGEGLVGPLVDPGLKDAEVAPKADAPETSIRPEARPEVTESAPVRPQARPEKLDTSNQEGQQMGEAPKELGECYATDGFEKGYDHHVSNAKGHDLLPEQPDQHVGTSKFDGFEGIDAVEMPAAPISHSEFQVDDPKIIAPDSISNPGVMGLDPGIEMPDVTSDMPIQDASSFTGVGGMLAEIKQWVEENFCHGGAHAAGNSNILSDVGVGKPNSADAGTHAPVEPASSPMTMTV